METVTVIVVLGILSAYAFSRMDITVFRSAAFEQELRAALRFAQKFALVSGCDVQVRLDASAESYALFLRGDATASAAACLSASGGFSAPLARPVGGSFSAVAPSGVDLSTTLTFFYDKQGRPSVAGAAINLDGRSIVVENVTGFVH